MCAGLKGNSNPVGLNVCYSKSYYHSPCPQIIKLHKNSKYLKFDIIYLLPPLNVIFTATTCDVHAAPENEHIIAAVWVASDADVAIKANMPLSRCLDRCDRMIQNESRNSNGGNVRLFTAATYTSQCKLRSFRANVRLSA